MRYPPMLLKAMPVTDPAHPTAPRHAGRGTVIATMFHAVLRSAEAAGLQRASLLARTGVSESTFADPEARLPQPTYIHLWEIIEREVRDPFFGLHFAEAQVDAATFSIVGFVARSSRTYGEALERVARFSRVLNEAEEISLARERGHVVIGQNPRGAAPPWPRHKTESAMANYVVLGRRWTGSDWAPHEVCFRHAAPPDVSVHRRIFRCSLRFDHPRNEVRLDPAILAFPFPSFAPDLGAYLSQRADSLLSATGQRTLLDDVRRGVREALPSGRPELSTVARRLGQSARSLQRRLAEEGTSFAELVDEVRRELALELVADRRVSIEEAGCLLGFADTRGFRRAFERWTGTSPRAYRGGSGSADSECGVPVA